MKLHAGSLYKKYLVLYGDVEPIIIEVDDKDLQWEIYCNDVEVEFPRNGMAEVTFKGRKHEFYFMKSENPMKDLGFASGNKS